MASGLSASPSSALGSTRLRPRRQRRLRTLLAGLAASLLVALPAHASSVLDVVFLMDGSASVSASGWAAEQAFVTNLVGTVLRPGITQVGWVRFGQSTNRSVSLTPLEGTSATTIVDQINGLTFLNSAASHTLDAVNAALTLFDMDPDADNPKLMIMLTDGHPNPLSTQDPCGSSANALDVQARLAASNVIGYFVGVGADAHPSIISCLFNDDPSHFYSTIGNWTNANLEAIYDSISSEVPEPASWSLVALGLGLLLRLRPRARASSRTIETA